MNRRNLLKAAPAALLSGAIPVMASEAPAMACLYHQWLAAKQAYNDYDGFEEAQDIKLYGELTAIEDQLLAIQPRTVEEYAFKLVILNDFAFIEGTPWGDAMMAEARALIGGLV